MSKTSVAAESIYGFAPEQAEVSPEEPIFVLTGSQLKDIISRAIQEATELLYQEDRQRNRKA